MASIDLLISKLDRKLRSLHQEQSLVTKTGKTGILEQPCLSEYLQLVNAEGIVPGVELIAMDALSKHFNLYEDRERQQILAAMAEELSNSSDAEVLSSIQNVKNIYPSIYSLDRQQFDLIQERAGGDKTRVDPLPPQPDKISKPIDPTPFPHQTLTNPQNNSVLLVVMGIVCAAMFGALISQQFNNKLPNSTAINSGGTERQSSENIMLGNWSGSYANGNSVLRVTARSGKSFTGQIDTEGKRGEKITLNITGEVDPSSKQVSFKETAIVNNINDVKWWLGENSGVLSDDKQTISGNGSDSHGNRYAWNLSKKASVASNSSNTQANTIDRPSPSQFLKDHYQQLNQSIQSRNYDMPWSNLSANFRSSVIRKSEDIARKEYEEWWNSVRSVDLQRSETLSMSSDGNKAIVSYSHGYTMTSGRFVQDKHTRIFLVWDRAKNKWSIDSRS
jgi:hypothetical protein